MIRPTRAISTSAPPIPPPTPPPMTAALEPPPPPPPVALGELDDSVAVPVVDPVADPVCVARLDCTNADVPVADDWLEEELELTSTGSVKLM